MTDDVETKEFRKKQVITINATLTPEQVLLMGELSERAPTLYFLDICVVDLTKKDFESIKTDDGKKEVFERLKRLDRSQNGFSYLMALMEKVSDCKSEMADAELDEQILGDVNAMRTFFSSARVIEDDNFLISFAKELRRQPIELDRAKYLDLLKSANDKFELWNPASPKRRVQKVRDILAEADSLRIPRQHPVVLVCLGCIYRNPSAIRLANFKGNTANFNSENTLADVMLIQRFADRKLELEASLTAAGRYERTDMISDDDGVMGFSACFEYERVKRADSMYGTDSEFEIKVNFRKLLTDLNFPPTTNDEDLGEGFGESVQVINWLSGEALDLDGHK